ncbi:uncharacterized protein PADG_02191 [Paracoccidioides brasiliensis Pb18]|uniref:Uncharacterized protein n=1 Tax=Paracoccidioides brasiliensis (strain Pb18) TaxID=502780 RepID=C1G225_PARBD|nr:uncharacterized protein PADG_02191 [Paracoccidioides brasiliensis Pb18]EEH46041.1 hypothetical protein PADG_02191 [Paracoccidioides brasiliensis Pb18]
MAQAAAKSGGESPKCSYTGTLFSPTSPPVRRAQSLTVGNLPLKRPDDPSTTLSGTSAHDPSFRYFFGYIEQSQLAIQSLRTSFERERAAFAEERKLWEKERTIMKLTIAELEKGQIKLGRMEKTPMPSNPIGMQARKPQGIHHIWEGSGPTTHPTRIFLDEVKEESPKAPALHRNHHDIGVPPSLDEALSPRMRPVDRSVAVGVPIELVDSSLDGITLKSTALPPDVLARASSLSPMPLASPPSNEAPDAKHPLRISLSELGPPEENLVRDAGHTPKPIVELGADISNVSTEDNTLTVESPIAPQQTLEAEATADSYIPDVDDDRALEGPLGLKNDEKQDLEFLKSLDQKLLNEARKITQHGPGSDSSEQDCIGPSQESEHAETEPEPGIKFKHSTNFGSAFGSL